MKINIRSIFAAAMSVVMMSLVSCATSSNATNYPSQQNKSENISDPTVSPESSNSSKVASFDAAKKSLEVIKDYAPEISGSPEIIVNTIVKPEQFEEYGLDAPSPDIKYPPMSFVLLQGDFDTSKLGGENKVSFSRAKYVALIFNSETGFLRKVSVSVDGAKFAKLLAINAKQSK
jgi:hypothetical protein